MTHLGVLTSFWILLAILMLRALPRLSAAFMNSPSRALAAGGFTLMFAIPLAVFWGLIGVPTAFFLALAAGIVLMDPVVAFGAYMGTMIFRPWELWPEDEVFPLLPRMGALWISAFALFFIFKQNRRISIYPASAWLLVFFGWCLFSAIVTPDPGQTTSLAMSTLMPAAILFFLLQFWIQNKDDEFLLEDFLSISITGAALLSLLIYSQSEENQRLEALGIFGNSNDVAALCVMALPLALRPWLRKFFSTANHRPELTHPIVSRIFSVAMALPLLASVLLSRSRGAWLGLAGIIGFGILMKNRSNRKLIMAGATALGIGIAMMFVTPFLKRDAEDLEQSTSSRIAYWKAGMNMALKNPVTGVGWGQFPYQFENYSSGHQFEFGKRTAHSSWILVLAETGWVGLALFAGLWIFTIIALWPLRFDYPEVLLSTVGYGITMTFLSHSFLFFPYILLGLGFAVLRRKKEVAI